MSTDMAIQMPAYYTNVYQCARICAWERAYTSVCTHVSAMVLVNNVHGHICKHAYTHVREHVHTPVNTHVHRHVDTRIYFGQSIWNVRTHANTQVPAHVHVYARAQVHAHVQRRVQARV